MSNLMEERLTEVLRRLHEELEKTEEHRIDLRRQISQLEFVRSGNQTAAADLIKTTSKSSKHKSKRSRMPKWSEEDDKTILHFVKTKGQIAGPEAARILQTKLKHRTEGAIRQRITRLTVKGVLKSAKGSGGVPHMLVEAA